MIFVVVVYVVVQVLFVYHVPLPVFLYKAVTLPAVPPFASNVTTLQFAFHCAIRVIAEPVLTFFKLPPAAIISPSHAVVPPVHFQPAKV